MSPQQKAVAEASSFVEKVNDFILFPLIALMSAVALLVFLYGSAIYILNADNDSARDEGKKHITYGLIGLLIMISAWALLSLAAGTFGLQRQLDCTKDPTASGCDQAFKL